MQFSANASTLLRQMPLSLHVKGLPALGTCSRTKEHGPVQVNPKTRVSTTLSRHQIITEGKKFIQSVFKYCIYNAHASCFFLLGVLWYY